MRNHRIAVLLLLMAMLLTILCGCGPSDSQTESVGNASARASNKAVMNQLKNALNIGSDKFPAWKNLPSGAVFAFWDQGYDPTFNEHQIGNVAIQAVDGELQYKMVFLYDDNVETRIFYREDWERQNGIIYPSSFQYYTNPLNEKVDVLIAVGQNYEIDQSYPEAEDGLTPEDTLGTKPLKFQQKSWNNGYPLWVFAIPLEKIDESYALRFGEYVLTGNDILDHTWKIGGAATLIYGHVVED